MIDRIERFRRAPLALLIAALLLGASPLVVAADDRTDGAKARQTQHGDVNQAAQQIPRNLELTDADREFLDKAITGNLAGIALGRLAQEESSDSDTIEYGEMMERDHKEAITALVAHSPEHRQKSQVAKLDAEQQARIERLRQLDGAEFDRQFAEAMVDKHQQELALFQQAANQPQHSQAIRELAQQTLPTLRQHLADARELPEGQRVATSPAD